MSKCVVQEHLVSWGQMSQSRVQGFSPNEGVNSQKQ